jgi:hypothetical protein
MESDKISDSYVEYLRIQLGRCKDEKTALKLQSEITQINAILNDNHRRKHGTSAITKSN